MASNHYSKAVVLLCGDVMLDRYWLGDAFRVSPEAPSACCAGAFYPGYARWGC
jgi:bifunctional ADP-heptose synthase (sugar kinase/adenylyltransferase)